MTRTDPFDKNGLVSIALATYNGEHFLREQLNSLLAQTYSNFEIVVSDDGSKDNTVFILDEYAEKDSRIKWSKNPYPAGFIKNFERAISLCKGKIIFLCDQDDIWHKNKLSEHLKAYDDMLVMWVYNEVRLVNEAGEVIGHLTDTIKNYYAKKKFLHYTWGSCTLGCATSYRASLLKDIWPADPLAPAHDSWIQLAIFPAKSCHIPAVLQDYRQHKNNIFGLKESSQDESKVISWNMKYLKSLAGNDRLRAWKRVFLFSVILGKYARASIGCARRSV